MTPRLLTNHDFANLIHMTDYTVGFIGLGNMGGPMAANLAKAGTTLLVHDAAGTQARAPSGAGIAADNLVVARGAEVALLGLPDGEIVQTVVDEIAGVEKRRLHTVIDTSSVGIAAARKAHARLAEAGVEYIDSPVSGGVSGARNASIAVMFAGSDEAYERYAPLLQQTAAKVVQVGHEPGMGQAMKLLNNFLSGTALAATSEAIAFGEGQGLDMATMLEVLNASSGRNTATADKFLNRILHRRYDAGFTSRLMEKDIRLYLEAVDAADGKRVIAAKVHKAWLQLEDAEPNADVCRMYPFVRDGGFTDEE